MSLYGIKNVGNDDDYDEDNKIKTDFKFEILLKSDLQTFGCVTVRTASRAFSRSPCGPKGPLLPPPDIGLRGS